MAEPKDIRRTTGDVSPNNFINPGVVDTSLGEAVQKIGEIGMQLDSTLAQERFGEAIETLRSQYITGKTPQEAASAPSVVDEEQPDPETDYVPTSQDKKSLADFGNTLDAHMQAVEQGVRSQDMFRIAAERLYRTAISKRPGLAREFRAVAERFLGFDVVGASLQFEAEQDEEYIKSLANAAKSKQEQEADLIKRQREVWEKIYPQSAFVPNSQWAAYTASKMPEFIQVSQAAAAASLAKDEITMLDLSGKKSAEADERFYVAQMDAIGASYGSGIDKVMASASQPDANGVRLVDSPQGMREVLTTLRQQLLSDVARVDQAIAGRQVSGDTKARYRALIDQDLARMGDVLSLKDDAEFMDRANNMLKAVTERKLLSNEDARLIAVMDENYGDVIMDRFLKDNGKTVALTLSQMLTDNMSPNQTTKVATRTMSQLIASVWPDGSKTPPDPIATTRAAQDISKVLSSFYLQDDANFRPQDFTSWEGREGILPMLTKRAPVIKKSLTPEEQGQIAAQIAAASGNSALRLVSLLQKKSPALVGKLDFASMWKADTPGLVKTKPGVAVTPAEQAVLNHFGKQFNRAIITKAMNAYTDADAVTVWAEIAAAVKPTRDIKAQAQNEAISQSAARTAQEGAGGPSREGVGSTLPGTLQGPAVGTVEDGYEYLGGDPSSAKSWRKAGGK